MHAHVVNAFHRSKTTTLGIDWNWLRRSTTKYAYKSVKQIFRETSCDGGTVFFVLVFAQGHR